MLLVMRVNMLNRINDWRKRGIAFPGFLSLTLSTQPSGSPRRSYLSRWWVPLAGESKAFSGVWNQLTQPFDNASADWSRLFSSIDAKKEAPLHNLGPTLPLQGKVVLSDRVVAEVDFQDQTNDGSNLVAARYDEYTPAGWKRGWREAGTIGPSGVQLGDTAPVNKDPYKDRKEVTADVVVDTPNGVMLTLGQPLTSSIDGCCDFINGGQASDIGAIHPRMSVAIQHTTVGTIPVASEDQLRKAVGR